MRFHLHWISVIFSPSFHAVPLQLHSIIMQPWHTTGKNMIQNAFPPALYQFKMHSALLHSIQQSQITRQAAFLSVSDRSGTRCAEIVSTLTQSK